MEGDKKPPIQAAPSSIDYKRVPEEEFYEAYSNNIFIESTVWDVKLIFGNVDLSKGPNTVVQHTSMTIPWNQLKPFIYFLQVHLLVHETLNGRVPVPKDIVRSPDQLSEEQKKLAKSQEVWDALKELFRKFSEANPEAFAG